MSLASQYAAAVAAQQMGLGAPSPFVGPNGRAEVTQSGGLRFVPNVPGSNPEISPLGVLAFRDWLTATFE